MAFSLWYLAQPAMTDLQRGHLVLQSRLTEVTKVQNEIISKIETLGYSREVIFAVRLALDEAVTNAIRHGNQLDPDKQVDVDYTIDEKQLSITICDQGPGFHPDDLPDPTLEENLTEPHGRGVMLMQAYMTQVSFNERGNCITMIKAADCKKPYDD